MATRPARKPSPAKTTRTPQAKAAKAAQAKPETTEDGPAEAGVTTLRTKDLIAAVAASASVKRKDIRPVLDAAFKAMGEALAAGHALNLPPLGKMSVKRTREGKTSDMVVLKLRRAKAGAVDARKAARVARGGDKTETLADNDE